jgi:DNA-binding response OmpR family regulator
MNTKKDTKTTIYIIAEQNDYEFYHLLPLSSRFEKRIFSIDLYKTLPAHEELGVLLLDCGFHIKKGLRLLKEIKAANQGVPIIFITETGTEETAIEAFRAGARDYFKKPVNLYEIQDTIASLVKVKKTSLSMYSLRRQISAGIISAGPLKGPRE